MYGISSVFQGEWNSEIQQTKIIWDFPIEYWNMDWEVYLVLRQTCMKELFYENN